MPRTVFIGNFFENPIIYISITNQKELKNKMNEENIVTGSHNIIMENRKMLSISGVTDVDKFDEKEILIYTQAGELTIYGKNLHVNSVSVETGDMTIEGDIWALNYGDKDRKSPVSFIRKLFR